MGSLVRLILGVPGAIVVTGLLFLVYGRDDQRANPPR